MGFTITNIKKEGEKLMAYVDFTHAPSSAIQIPSNLRRNEIISYISQIDQNFIDNDETMKSDLPADIRSLVGHKKE